MKSGLNSYSSLIAETFTAADIKKARGIGPKKRPPKKKVIKKSKKKSGRI